MRDLPMVRTTRFRSRSWECARRSSRNDPLPRMWWARGSSLLRRHLRAAESRDPGPGIVASHDGLTATQRFGDFSLSNKATEEETRRFVSFVDPFRDPISWRALHVRLAEHLEHAFPITFNAG
jgi:hypothetical protein